MPSIVKIRQPVRAIGIDLGTTNSTVAEVCWKDGQGNIPVVFIKAVNDGGGS